MRGSQTIFFVLSQTLLVSCGKAIMGGCESCTARTNEDRNEWQVTLRARRENTITGWLGIAVAVIGVASWAVSGILSHNHKKDYHYPIKKNKNMLIDFLKHVLPHHKRQQTVVSYDDAATSIAFQKAIDEVKQHGEEMLMQNMKLKEEKMKVEKDLFMSLSDSLKQNHALHVSNKVYRDLLDEYRKKEKDLSGRCEEMSNALRWRESELNAKEYDLNDVRSENHDTRGIYAAHKLGVFEQVDQEPGIVPRVHHALSQNGSSSTSPRSACEV